VGVFAHRETARGSYGGSGPSCICDRRRRGRASTRSRPARAGGLHDDGVRDRRGRSRVRGEAPAGGRHPRHQASRHQRLRGLPPAQGNVRHQPPGSVRLRRQGRAVRPRRRPARWCGRLHRQALRAGRATGARAQAPGTAGPHSGAVTERGGADATRARGAPSPGGRARAGRNRGAARHQREDRLGPTFSTSSRNSASTAGLRRSPLRTASG
jgi:hypothetical protein